MTAATAQAAPLPAEEPIDRAKLAVFCVMAFGMFMAILDIQIVAASLPQIQAGLAASPEQVSWVQTSYLIAEVMMIPISGYLARALSTRILFALSAGGFTLASFGCAMSWNMESLIVMRAVQGFVGGAMIPTVFATAFSAFPRSKAGPLSAAIGLIVTLAPTIGPTLGGAISEHLSWHWLFLVNIIPGILITVTVYLYAEFDEPEPGMLKRFDVTAFVFLAVWLGLGEYILEEGPSDDWFESRTITILTIVSAVAGAAFILRTIRSDRPLVELRAFRDVNFTMGCLIALSMGVALFGLVYLLPLFLARVEGLNSLQIGETLFVTGAAMFVAAPLAGIGARKYDPRLIAGAGLAVLAVSTWQMATLTSEWGYWDLFWPQVGRGVGLMWTMASLNVIALGTLPVSLMGGAAGLYNLMRNLGGAAGLAIINTVLTDRTAFHMRVLSDNLDPSRPAMAERLSALTALLHGQGVAEPQAGAVKILSQIVEREAMTMAFADAILLVTIVCVVAIFSLFLVRPPTQPAPTGAH
ncbi:MAG: DHA2 family efflux MFS transporter permease subunit [Parvularculaceae bacterium]|nr:DHA2 family efflux MFS transporter permease subunit [Parvularculaceae bacterium]